MVSHRMLFGGAAYVVTSVAEALRIMDEGMGR